MSEVKGFVIKTREDALSWPFLLLLLLIDRWLNSFLKYILHRDNVGALVLIFS